MKKALLNFLILCMAICSTLCVFTACSESPISFKLNFVVESEIVKTIDTTGNEKISLPENPTKDGYTFDGWFWDKDVWEKPFTANSLLDAPLSSDMSVYAKFTIKHEHNYTAVVTAPTCTERGYTTYTCECGDSYINDYVNKLEHEFTNYVSDNNATYEQDGTKTAHCNHGCGATNTITDAGTKLQSGIAFKTLVVDGNNVYGKIPNNETTFDFLTEIEKKGNVTYEVSKNLAGDEIIVSKTAEPSVGDNNYYILVYQNGDLLSRYNVTIRRREIYDVTFNTDGGTVVAPQRIEEDSFATEPTTTRSGYTFTGWDYNFDNPITENTEITAGWTANTDTKYKVEYYLQNLADNNYTLDFTDNLMGETDKQATAEIKTYNHYTYNASQSIVSGNINGDETTVLKVYYTRDIYEFTTTNENTKGGAIDCTANGEYKYQTKIDLSATINNGYDFVGWYKGDTQVSDELKYSFTLTEKTDITAKYSAHNNTKYTIETYLENLDGTYTKQSTEEKFGETDTIATVTQNAPEHYTLNSDKSILSGNINGNSETTLKVYYTRNTYVYNFQQKNERDDIINDITVYNCKYGKTITLYATLDGYDFIGWFNGDKNLSYELQYSFNISENVTIIAKYLVHKNTKYVIQCFIENLEGSYTKQSTEEKYGETNTIATVIPNPAPEHFIFNSNKSVLSKNINGDGSTILKIYYDLERFKINIYASSNNITLNTTYDGYYRYGDFIPEISATYNDYVGCQWNGWYTNDTFMTFDFTIPSFMVDKNIDYCAKGEKEEMANFIFISTTSTCEIIGIKNTNVKTIVIPKYVTKINRGALSGCSLLEEISIPFVGAYRAAKNEEAMFGYIFGYKNYAGAVLIGQEYNSFSGPFYNYIPSSLKSVIVTGDQIFNGAFSNCDMLTVVTIGSNVMSIGKLAFLNCTSLTNIIFENTNGWKLATKSDMSDAFIVEPFMLADSVANANMFKNSSRNSYWQRG